MLRQHWKLGKFSHPKNATHGKAIYTQVERFRQSLAYHNFVLARYGIY